MLISKNLKTTKIIAYNSSQCQIKFQEKDTFKFQHINQSFWKLKKFFSKKSDGYLLTLLTLLRFIGEDKKVCWPSVPTMAKMTGVCDRTIQRNINKLELDGLLAVCYQHLHGRYYQSNVYRLSNVLRLPKIKKRLVQVLISCLSEYVTLLKDSYLSLYRKKILILNKDTICKRGKKCKQNLKKTIKPIDDTINKLRNFFDRFTNRE